MHGLFIALAALVMLFYLASTLFQALFDATRSIARVLRL